MQTLNFFPCKTANNFFLDVVLRDVDRDGEVLHEAPRLRLEAAKRMTGLIDDKEITVIAGTELTVLFNGMTIKAKRYSNEQRSWWFAPAYEMAEAVDADEFLGNLR